MKATKRQVARWLLELMQRQVPQSVADAKRNTETATPAFQLRFEAAAFCQEAQDAIAQSERWWNEASVSRALEVWCKDHLSPEQLTALPAEAEAAPISVHGKHLFGRFLNAEHDAAALATLNLMRTSEPAAFGWVIRNDMRAADLVVSHGWDMPLTPDDLRYQWDDEAGIRRMTRKLMDLHRDMAAHEPEQRPGLGSFKSWSATVWLCSAGALTAAVGTNARDLLPIVKEEMEARPMTRRPRLFGE